MVVLCTIVKNEAANLLEWIAFHRVIGVNHFIILDNESTDATRYILRPLDTAGFITLIPWQTKDRYPGFESELIGPQVPGYSLALEVVRSIGDWTWVGFIDMDEFIVPTTDVKLQDCLESVVGAAALGISWHIFGSNGHVERPSGKIIENYTKRSLVDFHSNRHVKTIARVSKIVKPGIHIPLTINGPLLDMAGKAIDHRRDGIHDAIVSNPLRIHHYFTKSFADWSAKQSRGRATKSLNDVEHRRSLAMFSEYDRNDVEDLMAARYLPEVITEIAYLEREVVQRAGDALFRRLESRS